jgi:hypothetical protein
MAYSPAPIDLQQVLDTGWLSWALSQDREPVAVKAFEVLETIGPSALKIRMRLAFDGPAPADVPEQICIKGIFDPALTQWLKSGAQQAEANFYKILAPTLSVRVPQALYSGFEPETMAGLVIMEDLIPQGVHFLTALSPYTPEQARGSLDQLARLHGGSWAAAASGAEPWITPKLAGMSTGQAMPPARLTELLNGERGEVLPAEIKSGPRIYAALAALAERDARLGYNFVHGDAHGGNVWEGKEGVGLVDWQVLQRGHWSMDVAYHMGAALDVEDRRRSERDLLAHYLDRLQAHGGPPIPFEEAWAHYRAAAPYGMFMWGITQRVDPPIIHQFVTRLGTAVADHRSFELLGV